MNPLQILFLSFLFILSVLLLDAYGFKEQAEDLLTHLVVFFFGLALGAWLL